jgi:hypothetical protein
VLRLHLGALGKEVINIERGFAQALLDQIALERLERRPVRLDPIRPGVITEYELLTLKGIEQKWHRVPRNRLAGQAVEARILGRKQRLVNALRQPWVPVMDLGPENDDVHDREDPGAFEVLQLPLGVVLEQSPQRPGSVAPEAPRRARHHERVNVAADERCLQRPVCGDGLNADPARYRQRQPAAAPALCRSCGTPRDRVVVYAVIVTEDAAHPDRGRHLILRHRDPASVQVTGITDGAIRAEIYRRVPEAPGDEGRNRDEALVGSGPEHAVTRQRHLGEIELLELAHAPEALFRGEDDDGQTRAFDRDRTISQRCDAVVVAAGKREFGLVRHE